MDEFSFIERVKQKTYRQPTLEKGVGDDAALIRHSAYHMVTAVDTFVENVHFSRGTMSAAEIGYRVLAVNISDMAAMGASPAFYMVNIVIPDASPWKTEEMESIFSGMDSLAKKYSMDLIGGDTVSGDVLTIAITIIGYVLPGKARFRSTALPGDFVFATGTLGDSQAGYYIITHPGDYRDSTYYKRRHRMPDPPVRFAEGLQHVDRLCLNDISDGIANEAHEIADASHVSVELDIEKLPVSASFTQFPEKLQRYWKLFGGEDFELLGTAPESARGAIEESARQTGTSLTVIGTVKTTQMNAKPAVFLRENSQWKTLEKAGYSHLKAGEHDDVT